MNDSSRSSALVYHLLPYVHGKCFFGRNPASLTPREIEVLNLLADGSGNKAIAKQLQISEHTVKFHITSLFNKLGSTSRTEAVTAGIKLGLILL